MNDPKLNEQERAILAELARMWCDHDDWRATCFDPLAESTGIERRKVRLICRKLARLGLAAYERALVDEEGTPAGAGYRATKEGAELSEYLDEETRSIL